jgi:hypothetical protein
MEDEMTIQSGSDKGSDNSTDSGRRSGSGGGRATATEVEIAATGGQGEHSILAM